MTWLDEAACKGMKPGVFVLDDWRFDEARAKATCAQCPVIVACLADARQAPGDTSIRAGLHPKDRRKVKRIPAHGHRQRYNHYGCRCDECKAANTAYSAAGIRRRKANR